MPYNSSLKWMRIYKFYMLGLWCSFLTMVFEQGTFIEGNIYINKTRGLRSKTQIWVTENEVDKADSEESNT